MTHVYIFIHTCVYVYVCITNSAKYYNYEHILQSVWVKQNRVEHKLTKFIRSYSIARARPLGCYKKQENDWRNCCMDEMRRTWSWFQPLNDNDIHDVIWRKWFIIIKTMYYS